MGGGKARGAKRHEQRAGEGSIGDARNAVHDLRPSRRETAQAAVRSTIIFWMSAIALAGFRPLGHVLVQFMMVWQR